MDIVVGMPFTATIVDPGGVGVDPGAPRLGARVETPVNRAIVSAFRFASQSGAEFTVVLDGPLTVGDFLLVWRTDDPEPPEFEAFVPLRVVEQFETVVPPVDWPRVNVTDVLPSVDDVAALERTRTVGGVQQEGLGADTGPQDLTTFTEETRPTVSEVQTLIERSARLVLAQLRETFDPRHYDQVRELTALYTAILIEASYFHEQNPQQMTLWRQLYTESLLALQTTIERDMRQNLLLGGMEPRRPRPTTQLA